MSNVDDVTKMEGYDENSFHKGFEEGHDVGYREGYKRGQIMAVNEGLNILQSVYANITKDTDE